MPWPRAELALLPHFDAEVTVTPATPDVVSPIGVLCETTVTGSAAGSTAPELSLAISSASPVKKSWLRPCWCWAVSTTRGRIEFKDKQEALVVECVDLFEDQQMLPRNLHPSFCARLLQCDIQVDRRWCLQFEMPNRCSSNAVRLRHRPRCFPTPLTANGGLVMCATSSGLADGRGGGLHMIKSQEYGYPSRMFDLVFSDVCSSNV